jgi:hypothetical protein
MGLFLCSGCARHVRNDGAACPFCGASERQAIVKPKPRMSRSALIGAAAVALACSSSQPQDDAGTQDSGSDSLQGAYGGPPIDAAAGNDAAPDSPVAAYGGPPQDGGAG